MLNGVSLSARNRHIIGESPFRAVQEMALVSPRLVRSDLIDDVTSLVLIGVQAWRGVSSCESPDVMDNAESVFVGND